MKITFTRRPGTGMLWGSATYEGTVYAFTDAQLTSGDAGAPAVKIDAGANLNGPETIAFDGKGNLWTPDNGGNRILRFDVSVLDSTGSPPPAGAILGVAFDGGAQVLQTLGNTEGLAFDSQGNLWVTNCGRESSVIRYDATQLVAGGAVTPSAMLRDTTVNAADGGVHHTVDCVYDMTFDAKGGLWFMNCGRGGFSFNEHSIGYVAAPQALSGLTTQAPDLLVLVPFGKPEGIAFDAAGKLWVVAGGKAHRLAIDTSARGVVDAVAELSVDGASGSPMFDNAGALWIFDGNNASRRFPPTAPSGTFIFAAPSGDANRLTLNPAPPGLPLHLFP